jgi:serine/threonine protein kinase
MGNCLHWCFGNRREYQSIGDHEEIRLIQDDQRDPSPPIKKWSPAPPASATNGSVHGLEKKPSQRSGNGGTSNTLSRKPSSPKDSLVLNLHNVNNSSSLHSGAGESASSEADNNGQSRVSPRTPTSANIAMPGANQSSSQHSATHGFNTSKGAFNMKYELKEEMGIGSTSKCYRCIRKTDGQEFACKVIDKRQVEMKFSGLLEQFYVEIKVLQSLQHPNIIHLEDTFETPERIYIIMEIMKGGELFDYVVEKSALSEEEASVLVRKIISAVTHMHNMDIIHRDLKPENLLLTNKTPQAEVKIIDFGLAKIMAEPVASSFLGTKGYLAPEMLQRHSYDKAIDMWAVGVIVFVLLCGCLPFDDDSSKIASDAMARKKFTLRFPKWAASLSASAKDLLHNLLEINPKARYTAEQALNHPWVSGKTVQPNNYLKSPCILGKSFCYRILTVSNCFLLGEKRRELRSPVNNYNYNEILDRASRGAAATTKATYNNAGHTNYHQQYNYDNPPPNRVRKNSF